MQRCLQLAALGMGYVAPNPMVGSVLVYNNRIIGEGYHQRYGEAHAEVNCLNSVSENDRSLISQSTLYVSLEPCAHFGKTPPCADLIIKNKIPLVVIGCRDSYTEVDGKGINKLQEAGIEAVFGILEDECRAINQRFFTFHTHKRPYIVLKWAVTANGFIGNKTSERLLINNDAANRLVHKWRSEEAAILVGTNTALLDNPSLNNRLFTGKQPIRLVIDKHLTLPQTLQLFNRTQPTIIFNNQKHSEEENLFFYQLDSAKEFLPQLMNACYQLNIQSILVEGGSKTLQHFIDNSLWDEARVITNKTLTITDGVAAPILTNAAINHTFALDNNILSTYSKDIRLSY